MTLALFSFWATTVGRLIPFMLRRGMASAALALSFSVSFIRLVCRVKTLVGLDLN